MQRLEEVKNMLAAAVGSDTRVHRFDADTPLLGALPELDSMAIMSVLASLETWFGIEIEDDELDATLFESVGSLTRFVDRKMA